MFLFDTPFYKLEVGARDSKRTIQSKAEDVALLNDTDVDNALVAALSNPAKRLVAEVAWLPGLPDEDVKTVLKVMEKNPEHMLDLEWLGDDYSECVYANALLAAFKKIDYFNKSMLVQWIIKISEVFDNIDAEYLLSEINDDREEAGFPLIDDAQIIQTELNGRRKVFAKAFRDSLNDLSTDDLVDTVTQIIEEDTSNGEINAYSLIYDLIDLYEVETQDFFDKTNEVISGMCKNIISNAKVSTNSSRINKQVDDLLRLLRRWDKVAQPIQVSMQSKGLNHKISEDIAWTIRNLAIDLFNNHGELEITKKINLALQQVFAEVFSVVDKTEEDEEALKEIEENRRREAEEEARERERMKYSAYIGDGTVYVDYDGVQYRNRRMNFDDIKYILWGGINHTYDGRVVRVEKTINMHDGQSPFVINITNHENEFENIIRRIYERTVPRLIFEMCEFFMDGGSRKFGNVEFRDNGITMMVNTPSGTRWQTFDWNHVTIGNLPGAFCLKRRGFRNWDLKLEYLQEYDVHIIEALMRMSYEKGNDNLSEVFFNHDVE